MSTIYLCAECSNHYCADCDGGLDACEKCHIGPLCDGCAFDHDQEHRADAAAECPCTHENHDHDYCSGNNCTVAQEGA